MMRKSARKFTKRYRKKNKKTMRRKYKGGLTPKATNVSRGIFKNKTGNFGFTSQLHKKEEESFGFSSTPKKSTVRCDPDDPNYNDCIEMEKLKKIADNRKPPLNTDERRAARLKAALETRRNLEQLEEERQYNFYLKEKNEKKYKKK